MDLFTVTDSKMSDKYIYKISLSDAGFFDSKTVDLVLFHNSQYIGNVNPVSISNNCK